MPRFIVRPGKNFQGERVKTLYLAELDSVLMDSIKNMYPHLLEKPLEE